ncbi:unnamed protein product, partial [Allacma fusca]
MSLKVVLSAFAAWYLILLLPIVKGQIPENEVPAELQFVLDPELDKWKSPEELQKDCPYYLSGFDEENRPIWIVDMGIWPTRDILAKGPEWEESYSKHVNQMIKRVYDSIRFRATPENPVTEFNIIVDLDNYTIRHFSSVKAVRFSTEKFSLVTKAAKFGNVVYAVNTNFFAEVVINILRPVLGSSLERVEVFGTNSETW